MLIRRSVTVSSALPILVPFNPPGALCCSEALQKQKLWSTSGAELSAPSPSISWGLSHSFAWRTKHLKIFPTSLQDLGGKHTDL